MTIKGIGGRGDQLFYILVLTGLPLYLESWKNLEFEKFRKKPGKTCNFEQKSIKPMNSKQFLHAK